MMAFMVPDNTTVCTAPFETLQRLVLPNAYRIAIRVHVQNLKQTTSCSSDFDHHTFKCDHVKCFNLSFQRIVSLFVFLFVTVFFAEYLSQECLLNLTQCWLCR